MLTDALVRSACIFSCNLFFIGFALPLLRISSLRLMYTSRTISSYSSSPSWFLFSSLFPQSVGGPYIALDTEGVDEARDDQVSNIYVAAFYFTLTTMTSVGYGDIVAKNQAERIYTIFLEFTGAILFAMIIASLTSVVSSMDMNKRKTAEQVRDWGACACLSTFEFFLLRLLSGLDLFN